MVILCALALLLLAACSSTDLAVESTEILIRQTDGASVIGKLDATVVDGEIVIVADARPEPLMVEFYLNDEDRPWQTGSTR
jgi:hypothetical protein